MEVEEGEFGDGEEGFVLEVDVVDGGGGFEGGWEGGGGGRD